jgi:hypothetical protein
MPGDGVMGGCDMERNRSGRGNETNGFPHTLKMSRYLDSYTELHRHNSTFSLPGTTFHQALGKRIAKMVERTLDIGALRGRNAVQQIDGVLVQALAELAVFGFSLGRQLHQHAAMIVRVIAPAHQSTLLHAADEPARPRFLQTHLIRELLHGQSVVLRQKNERGAFLGRGFTATRRHGPLRLAEKSDHIAQDRIGFLGSGGGNRHGGIG